jgi:hypothetical protein
MLGVRIKIWIFATAAVIVMALIASRTLHNAEPSGANLPSVPQGLANGPATFRNQLELDPELRAAYAVHQRFMNLYYLMPTFEHAAFGPTVTFANWRSVKWNVQSIYVKPDGSQIAELTYGPGPGVDYSTVTDLIGGHYVGNLSVNWAALTNGRHLGGELMSHNQLPIDCRDARSDATPYAVVPTFRGGTSITKAALRQATLGVSDLPGTHVICYRFARLHLVEFAHLTDAVIYRLDHGELVPVTRGDIRLSDPSGRWILIMVDAGYDQNNLPLHDYLEALAYP